MDPHNPAKRKRLASARQRRKATSNNVRMRHTQRPSGGGVSADERGESEQEQKDVTAAFVSGVGNLRDRLQSGATATMNVVNERVRNVSQRNRKHDDPLARPSTWIIEPSWNERFHSWLADVMPFTWRERARRRGFWRRRIVPIVVVIACLGVAVAVGMFALNTAGPVAGAFSVAPPEQATAGGSVMISPLNNVSTTPTPAAEQYDIGVWVSDTLPQGGSVTVYVRVSNNTQPQPGARVFIHASTPNGGINIGPLTTDAYGLASAQLNYGNVGSQKPIFLTASTTISGQTITGTYTFVTF